MSYRLVPWCRRAVWRRLVSCRVLRGVAWCSVVSSVVLLFSRGRGVAPWSSGVLFSRGRGVGGLLRFHVSNYTLMC